MTYIRLIVSSRYQVYFVLRLRLPASWLIKYQQRLSDQIMSSSILLITREVRGRLLLPIRRGCGRGRGRGRGVPGGSADRPLPLPLPCSWPILRSLILRSLILSTASAGFGRGGAEVPALIPRTLPASLGGGRRGRPVRRGADRRHCLISECESVTFVSCQLM